MKTNIERLLDYLWSVSPNGATNADIRMATGIPLNEGQAPGVSRLFDFVSPDGSIVGDAKIFHSCGWASPATGKILCHLRACLVA
jgi:hypothetical protein